MGSGDAKQGKGPRGKDAGDSWRIFDAPVVEEGKGSNLCKSEGRDKSDCWVEVT